MSLSVDQQSAGNVAQAEEAFLFADDLPTALSAGNERALRPWRVLITDDDEEVHRATTYALRGVEVDGRPLELLHASSASEAVALLQVEKDIAVGMLDVVMETPDAGLRLVETIRNELGLRSMRIVLRTGQPGYAPELDVIRRYDINDYRTKSELTQTRLITTLTAGLRAYEQLELVRAANRGMETVARASNEIFRLRSTQEFSRVLLQCLAELLGRDMDAVVCLEKSSAEAQRDHGLYIESAAGRYVAMQGCAAEKALDVEMLRAIRRCTAARSCVFEPGRFAMWLGCGSRDAVVVVDLEQPLHEIEHRLVEMFASSLAVGFENVDLIERLDFFAFFDPLTHLPNRTRFIADVDQDLFSRQGGTRCLAIADIVRFSEVNDALGHRCGDSLLVAVSKRLRVALGTGVTLSRIAADSFGIYGPENAVDPESVRKAFELPFFVHGHALAIQMRMGLVQVSQCKGNAVELLRNANLALTQARRADGGSFCEFSVMMSEDVQTRVSMLHNLRAAIDFKRGLSVHYQPLVNAASGEVLGVEALLRWRNDFGEMVPPLRFIPLAERTGMINELGLWVLEQALDRLAAWHRQGHRQLGIAINISPVQLRSEDFVPKVRRIIEYCDVPPAQICFEFTEAVGLEDPVLLAARLGALRELGIRLGIDDFGTGHSSLRQLIGLATDVVKIDPTYIEQIAHSAEERALAASVVELARSRCPRVVAEGVETAEQAQALLAMGCELMQGFHFGRPMAADQFDAWLRGNRQG
ncbi:EAL domain-containing protein [Uliginosibacterium sp. 31-16]|uniref:putative bifunctional diguanylate cyclase/phosphodiesterase n=1 Tax=Uliginosibacterium sp. 31-16 TaxID=3068315 RepID=UPI00273FF11F|nr:EAL domain-containing protein [Uliginosibacterium sp. 31-16]MDP5239581.1 EAL domain-containing protein [Uliginosibacterium sp. 31-16]